MPSTTRRRLLPVATTFAAVLLLAVASPAFASPTVDAPASPIDWVLEMWAGLVDRPGSERSSASSKATITPNGNETAPPIVSLNPDGDSTTTQDDGESVPNLDPNG